MRIRNPQHPILIFSGPYIHPWKAMVGVVNVSTHPITILSRACAVSAQRVSAVRDDYRNYRMWV